MSEANVLYVLVTDEQGRFAHKAIGSAIVEADMDARLTTLALRKGVEPLATYYCASPARAEHAMKTLADLGDVEFDASDFDPTWFDPEPCMEAIRGLLEHGRKGRYRLSEEVRRELELLHRVLAAASDRSRRFYLVEVVPDEDLNFAGPELD